MPITNPAGDPSSYPATVERSSNGVGTTTFWGNTFDPLLNRTAYLHEKGPDLVSGQHYRVSSRSLTRAMRGYIIDAVSGLSSLPGFTNLAAAGIKYQAIKVPDGATITAITCYINPPNDGTLPGTNPSVRLKKVDITTGTATDVSSTVVDPAATVGAYETVHGFGPTGLSEVVDNTTTFYYAYIVGEGAPNETTIALLGCTVDFTVSQIDEG